MSTLQTPFFAFPPPCISWQGGLIHTGWTICRLCRLIELTDVFLSSLLCSFVVQVVLSCLCNPPQPGDPSFELFQQERALEFASLARRAALASDAFNSLPNMSVVPTKAAMYSFPQVRLGPLLFPVLPSICHCCWGTVIFFLQLLSSHACCKGGSLN
jgi:hypothetical protein